MTINLEEIRMKKKTQYEAIITTSNEKNESNASPFAIFYKGRDEIICRIFKGSTTLENILTKKEFVVNISNNPLMFTLSLIDTIPEEHLSRIKSNNSENELVTLKNSEAYFIVKVTHISEGLREDNITKSGLYAIKGKVTKLVINDKCVKPMNRGIHALIESLVNYSRIDLVDSETQEYYLNRFKESERIIKKVGHEEEKESIKLLRKELEKKNYKID